jgi:hypothetical protein
MQNALAATSVSSSTADAIAATQSAIEDAPAEMTTLPPVAPASTSSATNAASNNPQVPLTASGLAHNLLMTRSSKERWTPKRAKQMNSTAALLIRVVGHDDFTRLRQQDFASYRDALERLFRPRKHDRRQTHGHESAAKSEGPTQPQAPTNTRRPRFPLPRNHR